MDFEWDKNKAQENIKKHGGITFEEASLAFFDEWAIEEFDDTHSDSFENRFILIGLVGRRLLRNLYRQRKNQNHKCRKSTTF